MRSRRPSRGPADYNGERVQRLNREIGKLNLKARRAAVSASSRDLFKRRRKIPIAGMRFVERLEGRGEEGQLTARRRDFTRNSPVQLIDRLMGGA